MKTARRLRKRIEKAMKRDARRQADQPDDNVMNAFAFMMDMNRAILKTLSELVVDVEHMKKSQHQGRI